MCAGNNDELYARAKGAGEADYLLEESLRKHRQGYPAYQQYRAEETLREMREAIAARRDGYLLAAFDRAVAAIQEPNLEQARALVESAEREEG